MAKSLALCKNPLTNLSELRSILDCHHISPKRRFSQNFLVDSNILDKILNEADIAEGDCVLDIGAGIGAFTEALLQRGANVIAIEKDPALIKLLKRFPVEIFEGDVMHFPLERLSPDTKVVSNLPFHLATPILMQLGSRYDLFSSMTLILQEEMIDRICSSPNCKNYGFLTLFLQFYSISKYVFRVSRHCFYPRPHVDCGVVTLTLQDPPKLDHQAFFLMIRTAFQQRRKKLSNSLERLYGSTRVAIALEEMGIDQDVRAENLSLNSYIELHSILQFKKISDDRCAFLQ